MQQRLTDSIVWPLTQGQGEASVLAQMLSPYEEQAFPYVLGKAQGFLQPGTSAEDTRRNALMQRVVLHYLYHRQECDESTATLNLNNLFEAENYMTFIDVLEDQGEILWLAIKVSDKIHQFANNSRALNYYANVQMRLLNRYQKLNAT